MTITLFQQSLESFEKIGDVQGKTATLHQMAIIYANQGRVDEAIALYQQSLELKEKIGDVQGKAATLYMMGQMISLQKGDFITAETYLNEALDIYRRIGSQDAKQVEETLQQMKVLQMIMPSGLGDSLEAVMQMASQMQNDPDVKAMIENIDPLELLSSLEATLSEEEE